MNLLVDLTPEQIRAVTHVQGPLLVLAGAGSGKTRVITRRIAYMMSRGIPGSQILALTFTNKAAAEMRHRVAALVPDSGVWVGTFHGLCARLLRQYAPLVGIDRSFTIYDQGDRLRAVKQAMERAGVESIGVTPERVEAVISRWKNDLRNPQAAAQAADADHVTTVVGRVAALYQEILRSSSAVDFDDLLAHMVMILRQHPDVRRALDARFRYVLVDEYQDTNLAQYAILRGLSTDHPNLCVTGDPDQSIYGWRGANLNNILGFEQDFRGCAVVRLERNYRSTKNILRVADHLIHFNKRRKAKSLTTENPSGDPVRLTTYATETDEAGSIVGEIVERLEQGERDFRDFAIFCRMTALTRPIEAALRAAKVPYQVVGGVSYYERQEVKDVLAYLNLLSNPRDDLAFLRVVNTPPRGVGKTTLERLATRASELGLPLLAMAREASAVVGVKDRAARGLRDFVMLMDELASLREHPAEEVLRRLLGLSGYHAFLESDAKDGGEDRLANVDELVSAARQFDRENPGSTILDFVQEVSLSSAVDRWKDGAGAVAVMTLHAAKGLEFPIVYVVGLEQGILPHSRSSESDAELEEERRLLFVGMTRARQELFLSHCRVREFRGQRSATIPSCFLSELPEEAVTIRDRSGYGGSAPPLRHASTARPLAPSGGFRLTTAAALEGSDAEPAPGSLDAFRPGARVLHPEYGLGRIVAVEGAGPNRKGRVAFAVGGERTFILARSPLRLMPGR